MLQKHRRKLSEFDTFFKRYFPHCYSDKGFNRTIIYWTFQYSTKLNDMVLVNTGLNNIFNLNFLYKIENRKFRTLFREN